MGYVQTPELDRASEEVGNRRQEVYNLVVDPEFDPFDHDDAEILNRLREAYFFALHQFMEQLKVAIALDKEGSPEETS